MPDETAFDAATLVTSAETAAGFWQMGILWAPLIPGESTRGTYSLMEQLMPAKAGPPPHVHDQGEEVFYILDGEMALQLGDQVVIGTSGQLVRIPAGTPHAFAVRTETARVLNFYVPAALDLQVAMLGTPATSAILPRLERSGHRRRSRSRRSPSGCTTWPPKRCPHSGTCSGSTETTAPRTRRCRNRHWPQAHCAGLIAGRKRSR
ncbi:MAG: cupin domain-containing protein [Actinomycetota bacterium]|nr:cupin domain-containing protein [Actinomycetota bacterium]